MTHDSLTPEQQEQAMRDFMAQQEQAQQYVRSLTWPQLALLSDEDLFQAIRLRLIDEANTAGETTVIPMTRQVMHVLVAFYDEFKNGGLCMFFAGGARVLAPDLPGCLEAVGASTHAQMLDAFMNVHNLDPEDLESFACTSMAQFLFQSQRLPFDDFDRAFEALMSEQPLEKLCAAYIRANHRDFA